MQGEPIDNMDELIRAASGSHHPAYNDKSWEMMEALLNKHLPVKKDRRKPFIFFLLFFIAGGLFVFFNNRPDRRPVATATPQPALKSLYKTTSGPSSVVATGQPLPSSVEEIKAAVTLNKVQSPTAITLDKKTKFAVKKKTKSFSSNTTGGQASGVDAQDSPYLLIQTSVIKQNKDLVPALKIGHTTGPQAASTIDNISKEDTIILTALAIADSTKNQLKKPSVPVAPDKKVDKKGFPNNFGLYLSTGTDLSFVGFKNESKARLSYGAGLSYQVGNRITVRTGFYIAPKTYSANGADYHPPASYWTNNADLKNVYADCKIYEIPLSAYYNFKETAFQSWFAGVGLSTFLMKRETYEYYYKDAWGRAMNKTWTLKNGGNQYFSVLTISGGYQYKVTPGFSLAAEPYFKLPLQGIGFGKIKLNSGGLLFMASIKPFARKK